MSESPKIRRLLKNIGNGLAKYSIDELNKGIISFINKKEALPKEIDFFIDNVCATYGITKRKLMKSKEIGEVTQARQLTYCLLYDCLSISQGYIATHIFDKSPATVNSAIKYYRSLNMNVKADKEFKDKYDLIYAKWLEFSGKNK